MQKISFLLLKKYRKCPALNSALICFDLKGFENAFIGTKQPSKPVQFPFCLKIQIQQLNIPSQGDRGAGDVELGGLPQVRRRAGPGGEAEVPGHLPAGEGRPGRERRGEQMWVAL